jgi:N-acetylmuramoyl-L-alanine amidase
VTGAVKPWLTKAGSFDIEHIGGIPHFNQSVQLGSPRTGVLHTTEGGWSSSLDIFKQHFAPHFILGFDKDENRVRIAQMVQIGTIGGALKAHNAQVVVQIEMIGFSKEEPWLPDNETADALASLMAVCKQEYEIPLEHPWKDGDFGKAGKNPHRTSGKFGKIPGWFGHGDCPSPDTHWDPGNLEWSKILELAKGKTDILTQPKLAMAPPTERHHGAMEVGMAPRKPPASKSKKPAASKKVAQTPGGGRGKHA